ncbi:MAG TPA: amino acid permease, partial [Bryobacteraceae bacterium]|nr:amino acid permease [Bryobacteraceae bacterium]
MGNPLFARKPLGLLLKEAEDSGSHTLRRTLGPFQLTALGVGAIIGAGIFVLSGLGAHYAGPGLMLSFVLSGMGCAFAGLCYAEFAAMIPLAGSAYTYAYATLGELFAWIIGWDLTLEYAMGASTVSSGWSNHFIELLDMFNVKMPLWLAYDHWTALRTAENIVARQMTQTLNPNLVPGTQPYLTRVTEIMSGNSAELVSRAHQLV